MDIKKLKSDLEKNIIEDPFFVFCKSDDSSMIIINQYINKIASILNLTTKQIDSISLIPDESFIEDTNLYIIYIDKYNTELRHKNTIIICDSSNNQNAIKIPKLESWQVVDYAITKVNGLSIDDLNKFIERYKTNYGLFLNDIDKISSIDSASQKITFNNMISDGEFDYASPYTVFDLSNAIIKKDMQKIRDIMKVIQYVDITDMYLNTVLWNNFKNLAMIQLDPNCKYQDLGISDKQYYVIKKYNCGYYSKEQLIDIIDILSNVEVMFKYKGLEMKDMVDYLVTKILSA